MYLASTKRGEVMYWRKANQIHAWFERKLNKGEELVNCKEYLVKYDLLEDLLVDCIAVKDSLIAGGTHLKDTIIEEGFNNGEYYKKLEPRPHFKNTKVAIQLLPPQSGFFFGSTDIDEWYLKDIEETIETLSKVLSTKEKGERFYYHAWW